MAARLNLLTNPDISKNLRSLGMAGMISTDILPELTQELCKLRASQINATWREASIFTEAERAALEVTEQGTRIADAAGGVSDEAWTNASKHFDERQLAALVCMIATINALNRLNVINEQPAGDYQPGQFA
jgi:hypothetical protein